MYLELKFYRNKSDWIDSPSRLQDTALPSLQTNFFWLVFAIFQPPGLLNETRQLKLTEERIFTVYGNELPPGQLSRFPACFRVPKCTLRCIGASAY